MLGWWAKLFWPEKPQLSQLHVRWHKHVSGNSWEGAVVVVVGGGRGSTKCGLHFGVPDLEHV